LPVAIALFASGFLTPSPANALAMLCNTTTGECIVFDGACNGGGSTIWIVCFTLGPIAFTPASDHILARDGQAWLVQGAEQTVIASDALHASMTRMRARYPEREAEEPGTRREADQAWDEFLRSIFGRSDRGAVSASRLLTLERETGLRIVEARRPGRLSPSN
jgi:hypothetical protein